MEKITMAQIPEYAKMIGFSGADILKTEDIVLNREFRDACEANRCGLYGKCYMCPPDVGNIHQLMEAVGKFSYGILLQTISSVEDSYDIEGMLRAGQRHNQLTRQLKRHLSLKDALFLTGGGCRMCKICGKVTGEPCRFPEDALSSLEAYGISVSQTVAKTNLKYINGQNTVTYFGMILLGENNADTDSTPQEQNPTAVI